MRKTILTNDSHDPIFKSNIARNPKRLVTRLNISMSWNNATKIIGSKKLDRVIQPSNQ